MGFFDINYNQKAIELLPPDKRQPMFVAWMKALLSQVQYDRDVVLGDYKIGSNYSLWSAGTYAKGDRVIYGESVYEVIATTTTATPTNTTDWRVYLDDFVGVDERVLYNSAKLVLEYALNRRFQTTFNQPPTLSDIYIITNVPNIGGFAVGNSTSVSSIIYSDNSSDPLINAQSFTAFYNFTIKIPTAVYSALGGGADDIIRKFVDKYNTIGLNYNIETY